MVGSLFSFDANKETPQDVARRRAIAEAIMGRSVSPRNVGEGWGAIANGIVANVQGRRAQAGERAGQAGANSLFDQIRSGITGQSGMFPAAPSDGANSPVAARRDDPNVGSTIDFARAGNSAENKQAFIASLMPAAIEASKRTGVDPRIIVAQAAQETGWGKSAPGNNFFGIKSHGKGGGQNLTTHEVIDGKRVKINDSFRAFGSPAESVAGYADFILQNPRYRPLMEAQGLDAQLAALGASGYATDPNYAQSVGAIARGLPMPAVEANEAMAGGTQVASLDPSIGMPSGIPPIPQEYADIGLSQDAWARMNAPDGAVPSPGPMPIQAGSAAPQASPPLLAPQAAQAQPQPVQMAQAGGERNPMSGGVDMQQSGGLDLQTLMEAAANPFLNEGQRSVVNALLQQKLQAQDPMRQLQLQKLQREVNAPAERKTTTVNGRLIDAQTGEEIANFSDPAERKTTTVNGRLIDAQTGQEIANFSDPTERKTTTINGRLVDAQTGEEIANYPDQEKPTSDIQEYEYAKERGYEGSFVEFQLAQKKAGATSVTTNVGEGDKFYENLDKKNAETFSALSETGVQARAKMGQIDRLSELLSRSPQGAAAMLKQAAGEYGINTEGLSDIQAAQALINELVPQQRQPGSGPMSDADLALFKQSLPRLINQPEGNTLIIDTMKQISNYQTQMGDIADLVADREISPAEGRKMIRELANPLEGYAKRSGAGGGPQPGAVVEGYRFKGGDPADQNNWELAQ